MSRASLRLRLSAALLLASTACKPDAPAATVTGPGDSEPAVAEGEPAGGADADAPPVVDDGRALWFAGGPGREAIVARERRDHDVAVARLDALLASDTLSEDDRGAAQWLRALEDLRLKHYESAAERFAEARKAPALALVDVRRRVAEAAARLRASQPELALALAKDIDATGTPHTADLLVVHWRCCCWRAVGAVPEPSKFRVIFHSRYKYFK
ncbi:MAG: hypothetical protein AAF721_23100, partial [Myxococcota bacterium]